MESLRVKKVKNRILSKKETTQSEKRGDPGKRQGVTKNQHVAANNRAA